MVSVVKQDINEISWFYRQSLRFQIMTNIVIKSLIIVLILTILIIVYIQRKIGDVVIKEATDYVEANVSQEMKIISQQMVTSFQTENYIFGNFLLELVQLTADVYNICKTPGNCVFRSVKTLDNDPLKITKVSIPNPNLPNFIDFSTSDLIYDRLTLQNTNQFRDYELYESLDFDDVIKNLVTDYLSSNIRRITFHRYSKSTTDYSWNIMKVYPCEYISWDDIRTLHENNPTYQQTEKYAGSTVMIKGPYEDYLGMYQENLTAYIINIKRPALSASKPELYFQISVEIDTQVIKNLFMQHNYRSTIEMIVMNKKGQLFHATDYWTKNKQIQPSQYIYDAKLQKYSGLNTQKFQEILESKSVMSISKLNRNDQETDFLAYPVLIKNTFHPNNMTDYMLIGVPDLKIDFICVIIFGEKNQMYQVPDKIKAQFQEQLKVVTIFSIMTGIITIMLVIVAVNISSINVDRPIRQLLQVCQFLNHKDAVFRLKVLQNVKFQLENLESKCQYQVKDLVNSFIFLIQQIITRIKGKTSNKKPIIQYPLNEFEEKFVKNAKGKDKQFEWIPLINKISNKNMFKR